jgi:hypothetical protein
MSKMLTGDVEGHLDVELEFHHFERRCVPMSKQVPEESSVSSGSLCSVSI